MAQANLPTKLLAESNTALLLSDGFTIPTMGIISTLDHKNINMAEALLMGIPKSPGIYMILIKNPSNTWTALYLGEAVDIYQRIQKGYAVHGNHKALYLDLLLKHGYDIYFSWKTLEYGKTRNATKEATLKEEAKYLKDYDFILNIKGNTAVRNEDFKNLLKVGRYFSSIDLANNGSKSTPDPLGIDLKLETLRKRGTGHKLELQRMYFDISKNEAKSSWTKTKLITEIRALLSRPEVQ